MAGFDLKAILPSIEYNVNDIASIVLPKWGKDIENLVQNGVIPDSIKLGITLPAGAPPDLDTVKVDITIKDTEKGDYLEIPVIPEKLAYTDGAQLTDDFKIIGLGNVSFPNGVSLDTLAWQSFFPGRHDAGYCRVASADLKKPAEYRNILASWKDNGTVLQVIVPAFDINKTVTIKSLTWDGQGFEGDIYYSLELQEYKKVEPKEVDVGGTVSDPKNKKPEERPDIPEDEINDGEPPVDESQNPAPVPTEDTGDWRDAGASGRTETAVGMGGLQAADRY